MTGALRVFWVSALVLALGVSAFAADVFPGVSFAFDPGTFEYAWTVTYTPEVNVYFTSFSVFTSLPGEVWTSESGAWVAGSDQNWNFAYPPNGDGTFALRWYAPTGMTVEPGDVWEGTFKITIPNTEPVPGMVRTYASVLKYGSHSNFVPGVVPEPSSMLALGGLLGLVPLAIRRRRK